MDSSSNHDLMLMKECYVKVSLSYAQILPFHAGELEGSELGTNYFKIFRCNLVWFLRHVTTSQSPKIY